MIITRRKIAEEMVPTPDIQGESSDVFGDPSTDSVSSWNVNEIIIIASNNKLSDPYASEIMASIVKTSLNSKGSNRAEIIMITSIVKRMELK